jgi:hypothetical protein
MHASEIVRAAYLGSDADALTDAAGALAHDDPAGPAV